MTEATVAELAELVSGELHGDGSVRIVDVGDLADAEPDQVCFVRNSRYFDAARSSAASALIVGEKIDGVDVPQVLVPDPQLAFAHIASHFHPVERATEHSIHPSAVIDPTAEIAEPVEIGAHVAIGAGAKIGAGTIVRPGTVIGDDVTVGKDCLLHARVVLYERVTVGDRVVIHSGTVIGADGFGYAPDLGASDGFGWAKVPQVGSVEIGDDVEIGANTAIDRATIGKTRIGNGSKLDNLVHVGHNCVVGEHNVIAGFSALSGTTTLGDRVMLAGHVVTAGHLKVCDDARVGGNSVLTNDITEPGDYMGYPLQKRVRWGRILHVLDHLLEIKDRVRTLERSDSERE